MKNVLSWGALFLPAAGTVYWTTSASTQTHAYVVVRFGHAKFGQATEFGRALLRPIRLASRSELFGCSFDGFGLLFLPAAMTGSYARYWSVFGSVWNGTLIAYGLLFSSGTVNPSFGPSRGALQPIRLASRQGCLLL